MTADVLLAFVGFAVATSITPGPNNMMLLASGANFGFWRTIPHIAGIAFGCLLMVLLVGLGLGAVFTTYPVLFRGLRYVGAAYLLLLAWRIAGSGPLQGGAGGDGRPMRFYQAAAFQWVNPKAWVMAVGAVTTYTPRDGFLINLLIIAVMFALINLPSVAVWAGFGTALRGALNHPARLRAFNVTMALLLVASLYPVLSGAG